MNSTDTTAWKQAYILVRQLDAIHKSIESSSGDMTGYPAHAKSYNRFLTQANELFESDPAFKASISHLSGLPTNMSDDLIEQFGRLQADIAVLQASVSSFFDVYSPQEAKKQIGFHQ